MRKKLTFGEEVAGYSIPVLNEREIRAAAGILFLGTFISFMLIIFKGNFVPVKYVVTLFFADFLVRVAVSPTYSPSLIIGRLIVNNQNPEYVGAKQKKFSWIIGFVLSATMFILMVIVNSYSFITGLVCLVCLIFLFFESAFGICLGCKFYAIFYKEKAQYCPGEICDVKARQPIQTTSVLQLLVVLAFIALAVVIGLLFNNAFKITPHNLFG